MQKVGGIEQYPFYRSRLIAAFFLFQDCIGLRRPVLDGGAKSPDSEIPGGYEKLT